MSCKNEISGNDLVGTVWTDLYETAKIEFKTGSICLLDDLYSAKYKIEGNTVIISNDFMQLKLFYKDRTLKGPVKYNNKDVVLSEKRL